MLALATDTFGTLLWPRADGEAATRDPTPPSFLRSIRPALDCAFGLPDLADAPDELAALVMRLQAGPLGTPSLRVASGLVDSRLQPTG